MNGSTHRRMRPLSFVFLLAACSSDLSSTLDPFATYAAARWSEWLPPENAGAPVNSANVEVNPFLSRDRLALYFGCNGCPGGFGGFDLWVARRASVDDPWGTPENLGAEINSSANEASVSISVDGHRMFFNSARAGGFGGNDIYMARRHDRNDHVGWTDLVNLGPNVNSSGNDQLPQPLDEGLDGLVLYFQSERPGGPGGTDIYSSVLHEDGTVDPAFVVEELSSPYEERGPTFSRDGLETIFASDRPGTLGALDLWRATRASARDEWSTPENLGATVNGPGNDAGPKLSFDGRTLVFHSALRPENIGGPFFDVWSTRRQKVTGRK
jgi:hypothetical protein